MLLVQVEYPGQTGLFSHGGPEDLWHVSCLHYAASGPASSPVLLVASSQHGCLAHTLLLVSIPVSFCSWLDFLVMPWTWLPITEAVKWSSGPSLLCQITGRVVFTQFPKTLEKNCPLLFDSQQENQDMLFSS